MVSTPQSTDLDVALDALAAGRINSPMSLRETGSAAKAEIERLRADLFACLCAMRISRQGGGCTDWTAMIAALEKQFPDDVSVTTNDKGE